MNHYQITPGRRVTFETIRRGVSAARHEWAPGDLLPVIPKHQINNGFRHKRRAATNCTPTQRP
jgi:hypothetical protein